MGTFVISDDKERKYIFKYISLFRITNSNSIYIEA